MKTSFDFIRAIGASEGEFDLAMSNLDKSGFAFPDYRREDEHELKIRRFIISGLLVAGLLALCMAIATVSGQAAEISFGVSVRVGPPPLPVYVQPPCPGPGYLWTPGYWAYDPEDGYYWVPGTWVVPPEVGLLWTPGYWGWSGSVFIWHAGYWGPHVGFYGGIDYGFGYPGVGFVGGEWRGREFFYNRAVNNFGHVHIANVYYHQVGFGRHENRVSFNGGPGGLHARPGRNELAAEHERHFEATSMQQHNVSAARHDHSQFANVNHGRPNVVAASRPGEFHGSNVVRAGSPASRPQEFHGQEQNHTLSRPPAPRGGGAPHENMNRPNYPNSRARVAGRENNPGREFHPAATPRDAGPRRPEANVHPQRRAPQPERQMQRGPERAHAEGGHAKGGRGPGHGR